MGRIEKLTLYSLVILLLWGNMVSGLGAGLACPDWPLCFGSFFPEITFPIFMEHGHRVLGLFVTVFFAFLVKDRLRSYSGAYKLIPILSSILLAIQIVAGALVVVLQLETNITTFHFGNAIIIFILIYTMCLYTNSKELSTVGIFTRANLPYLLLFVLIYCQLVLGAYVRHSNAGLACPDFPKCLGYWLPPYLSKTVFVHLFHRISGIAILLISFWLLLMSYIKKVNNKTLINLKWLSALVLLQVFIGVLVVLSKLAFSMTALHLLIALAIVGVILNLLFTKKEIS
jgi:cytochrome c oxidase assembly protein subunit 15